MILTKNDIYYIEKKGNIITKKNVSKEHSNGYEFETEVISITQNKIEFNINYIKDLKNNKAYKSKRFINKYSTWVASMILNSYKEAGLI